MKNPMAKPLVKSSRWSNDGKTRSTFQPTQNATTSSSSSSSNSNIKKSAQVQQQQSQESPSRIHSHNNNSSNNSNANAKQNKKVSTPVSPTGQPRSPARGVIPSGSSGILEAKHLVQKILDQITFHDSPQVNANFSNSNGKNSGSGGINHSHSHNYNDNSEAIGSNSGSGNSVSNTTISSRTGNSFGGTIHTGASSASDSHWDMNMNTNMGMQLPSPAAHIGGSSRQQHIQILPTIYSPRPTTSDTNVDANAHKHGHGHGPPQLQLQLQSPPIMHPMLEPSPTAADLGDATPFLASPSFANSHISGISTSTTNSAITPVNTGTDGNGTRHNVGSFSFDHTLSPQGILSIHSREKEITGTGSSSTHDAGLPTSVSIHTPKQSNTNTNATTDYEHPAKGLSSPLLPKSGQGQSQASGSGVAPISLPPAVSRMSTFTSHSTIGTHSTNHSNTTPSSRGRLGRLSNKANRHAPRAQQKAHSNSSSNWTRPGQGGEVIMGNLSLAALCVRTIGSIRNHDYDGVHAAITSPIANTPLENVNGNVNVNGKGILSKGGNNGIHGNGNVHTSMSIPRSVLERVQSGGSTASQSLGTADETMMQWQREVEMAPTFVSGNGNNDTNHAEEKEEGSGSGSGSFARRMFLDSLDGDEEDLEQDHDRGRSRGHDDSDKMGVGSGSADYLFPEAVSRSMDDMNPILEEDEDLIDDAGGDGDSDSDGDNEGGDHDHDHDAGGDKKSLSLDQNLLLSNSEEDDAGKKQQPHHVASAENSKLGTLPGHHNVNKPGQAQAGSNPAVYPISPRHIDPGEIPMISSLEATLVTVSSASSPTAVSPTGSALSPDTKLTISPDRQQSPKPRMQMFGSEYARHLSSESPFSPVVPKTKSRSRLSKRLLKKKRNSNSSAAASLMSAPSFAGSGTISGHSQVTTATGTYTVAHPGHGHEPQSMDGNFKAAASVSASTISNLTSSSLNSNGRGVTNLEDASADILSSAITDVVVTHGAEKPPKGYFRISQTSIGTELDTLKKSVSTGGVGIGKKKMTGVYLNVKKEPKWDRAVQRPCVTALTVIFPDRNEFVPPGFCVVRRYKAGGVAALDIKKGKGSGSGNSNNAGNDGKNDKGAKDDDIGTSSSSYPANLNYGTSGERVYLCYRRSREGNPITGMIPLQPSNNETVPEGYTVLERSPRNFVADINSKAGPPIFLAFRQRLANLETLRPLPLVLSVHYSNMPIRTPSSADVGNGSKRKRSRLKAYYCTGGTVVPSEIGKYHIMDRSTHPLISPSSVTNRLSLIQAARIKNSNTSVGGGDSVENNSASKKKRSDRSPSPMTLANKLVAEPEPSNVPSVESPTSLQYSNSARSEEITGGGVDAENDLIVSGEKKQKKDSLVDNILHLVNQISPLNTKTAVDEEDKVNKSLLVGNMGSSGADFKVDGEEVAAVEENNDDGMSIASSAKGSIFNTRDETNLQECFDAMSFIPLIQSPVNTIGPVDKKNMETLLQARIAVLTPILTTCYTHHGGSSILAIEGLIKLLNDTDFFLPDVGIYDDPNINERLTLLDLSIQVVCDVANSTARETNFLPCIEFVVEATHYAKGNLNARTIGYIMRFYLFVFYFGASVPTASSWPKNKTSGYSRKEGLDEANDTLLLSEDELDTHGDGRRRGYVPGGAPQAAALALKEFISIYLCRLRKMKSGGRRQNPKAVVISTGIEDFMKGYVESLIDGAVHQVDVSNFTQLALHQIHRSGGSELFWHDMMTSCGTGLFGSDTTTGSAAKDFYITSFAILSSIVKVSSGKVRRLAQSSEFVPRDVASKLLSLELLHHFLHQWGKTCKFNQAMQSKASKTGNRIEDSPSISTMAYTIRRLIIPCLLSNTRSGLDDIKVFRRMMRIVTELWCNPLLRRHIKIEIGVLIEHFVLKFLRLGPQVLPPKRLSKTASSTLNDMCVSLLPQQVCIVTEMKIWFLSEPRDILELYMNFDQVDAQSSKKNFSLLPSTHWKITQQMCGALCTLAEQCTDIVSDQIRLTRIDLAEVDSQSAGAKPTLHHTENDLREMTLVREGARYLQEKCFDTISQIVRSLMLCAAASSGANYNLLAKLREKQEKDNAKKQAEMNAKVIGANGDDEDSSRDSDGNMTVKSVSTIGNIVGGIMNKKMDSGKGADGMRMSESPRRLRQVPQLTLGDDDGDGIVEYWQTSIAAERRKNLQPSPREASDGISNASQKKPPRGSRAGNRYPPSTPPRMSASSNFRGASPLTARSPRKDDASIISFADESIRADPHLSQKFEENLYTAFEIMRTKSLKKALDYLIACNILTPSPRDIASFLRLYQSRIETSVLGDYLGEGGKDGDEVEHYNQIRFHYTSAISFVGMNVEQGLRHFLTNCGFRLPGEAQKIDRIMTTFSQCYWEHNAGDHSRCPFQDQDTVFLISFAIIMLNTDLHKTSMFAAPPGQSVPKQKQRKKMTKQEFLNNLRGVDNSEDLSRDYLSQIYDSIAQNPIAIYRPPENASFMHGALGKKTIKFSFGEFGHIIQGNIDLAGMIKHVIKSVKPSQELLRGLAAHEHPYLTIKNNRKSRKKSRRHLVPEELVRSAFCSLWHHFHGTINSALDAAHLDPKGLENCLDVLMYTLCTTICLDLTVERNAFTSQLVRVKFFRENRGLEEDDVNSQRTVSRKRDHLDYKNDPWYMRIEKAAESYHENAKIAALDEVDGMFKKLHASLKVDSTLKKEMIKVARRIRNGQILLNDPTRYFLKEGELAKRCNRTGRNMKYTFFLFSDVLIYAHKSNGMYKIHGELPLHLMKIMDLKSAKQKRSFHLIHPRKSFVITTGSINEKSAWLATINAAIGREVKRKARIEGARQNSAAFDR